MPATRATVPVQSAVPLRLTVAVPPFSGYEYENQPTKTPRNPITPPTVTPTPAYEILPAFMVPPGIRGIGGLSASGGVRLESPRNEVLRGP